MFKRLLVAFSLVVISSLCSIACTEAATQVDISSYVPYAAAGGGFESFLRVINTGTVPTPITVSLVDGATGTVGTPVQLTQSLAAGGAATFSAQQVEAALGISPSATERPRIRITATAATVIETQSFLLQPNGIFNEISAQQSGASVTVPNYVPAAFSANGYESYVRIINSGTVATPVTVARIDPANGQAGAAAPLIASLSAGAATTLAAAQIEAALGVSIAASERPQLVVSGTASILNVQSFLAQPGGAFTNISSYQSGTTVDVRTYVPSAAAAYTTYLRIINSGNTAAPVTATLIDDTTGLPGASGVIVASLPGNAAVTLTSAQVETALGVAIPAANRPRLRIGSSAHLTVQSFLLQPGGAFNEVSGAQTGTSVYVRTYIPVADAVTGYISYLRVINAGATATPVTVALVDAATGQTGNPVSLIASLPAGAAKTLSGSQVEAALGTAIAAGTRPRIQLSGNGTNSLEIQSFLIQPGGAFTEVSGGTTAQTPKIVFDYTYDTNGFFTPERRALMEAAAATLTARMIGTTWARVDAAVTGGSYDLAFINPSTLAISWNHNVVIPENQITVYLGATNFNNSPFAPSSGDAATQLLSINNVSGGMSNVLTNAKQFRPVDSSISFDLQGIQGFSSSITRQWYFGSVANLNTDGRDPADPHFNDYSDFYTTAIHELGHVLGIHNPSQAILYAGSFNLQYDPNFANAWVSQVQPDGLGGYVFTGPHAKQFYYNHVGQNIPLDVPTKCHWAVGVQSAAAPGVSANGWTFTSVNHDPNLPFRVGFSELEFGALQDLGYTITAGPSLDIQLQ